MDSLVPVLRSHQGLIHSFEMLQWQYDTESAWRSVVLDGWLLLRGRIRGALEDIKRGIFDHDLAFLHKSWCDASEDCCKETPKEGCWDMHFGHLGWQQILCS